MDLSAIIDEFNRRKAQAGQGVANMLGLQKKPANWFEQMQQGQNAVINQQQRDNINRELADMVERFTAGVVPPMIRQRDRAMQTDPSAASKPFTSDEIKQATPFVTAAAPIAYHGTPHTFDKFDASKIGTGQGAQSYGHGLYFAENPAVAKSYQTSVGGGWTNTATPKPTGNTYQVNIPDQHAARMLDWDKPLSEQSDFVKSALAKLGITTTEAGAKEGTGASIVRGLGGDQYASKMLNDAGIPGIKYLDQGSRTAGQGTRNFVVFDPAILQDVTRK